MKEEQFQQMMARATKDIQQLNAHLARVCPKPGEPDYPKPQQRIRQSSRPLMNQLERQFLNDKLNHLCNVMIIPQGVRFKLANGLWYKPDFTCIALAHPIYPVHCYEVKGPHSFRGGFENLKMAAHEYFVIKWHLVWNEGGEWKEQIVLP